MRRSRRNLIGVARDRSGAILQASNGHSVQDAPVGGGIAVVDTSNVLIGQPTLQQT